MPDLFGNEDRLETVDAKGVAVSLFDAAAEGIAYASGRNVAQVRTELVFGTAGHAVQTCRRCGATFFAEARADGTCNLCRAGYALCKDCGFEHYPRSCRRVS